MNQDRLIKTLESILSNKYGVEVKVKIKEKEKK